MKALFTWQLEGDTEELADALDRIASALRGSAAGSMTGGLLTSEQAANVVSMITDDARIALRVICENAPTVPFDEVLTALGKDGFAAGGVMTSIGSAKRKLGTEPFLKRNRQRREYSLDVDTATTLLDALNRYDSQYGPSTSIRHVLLASRRSIQSWPEITWIPTDLQSSITSGRGRLGNRTATEGSGSRYRR